MRLVILDRDGVINEDSPHYIKSADEWVPIPGSLAAIARFTHHGWRVAIASNQSGLARGLFDQAALDAMHAKMRALLEPLGGRIDHIAICPHLPEAGCDCRKPRPGLLFAIAAHFGVPLTGVPVIGDSEKDVAAARAAGAFPILVRTGNGRHAERSLAGQVAVYDDLAAAADAVLHGTH